MEPTCANAERWAVTLRSIRPLYLVSFDWQVELTVLREKWVIPLPSVHRVLQLHFTSRLQHERQHHKLKTHQQIFKQKKKAHFTPNCIEDKIFFVNFSLTATPNDYWVPARNSDLHSGGPVSNFIPQFGYSDWGFSWFPSVTQDRFWDTFKQATSFATHITSNSSSSIIIAFNDIKREHIIHRRQKNLNLKRTRP
jgi:hypothetical protein